MRLKGTIAVDLLIEILTTRWWMRVFMVTLSALSAILGLMGPLFQKNFLDRLSHSPQFSWLKFEWLIGLAPMPLLLLAFLSLLLSLGLYQAVLYIGSRESYMMQRILSQRIFDHTLKLRLESLRGRSVGEVVSIYTVDVPGATILLEQSLPQGLTIFFPLTLAPWVLIHYFDIPAWNLCLVLGSVLALNFILALRQSRFFALFKRLAAERVGFVNEWVQNMRSLRILGWIPVFEQKIYHVREVETQNRISMLNNGQTMNGIASSVTFLLNVYLISLLLHLRQEAVTPGTLLALLWIVGVFLTRSFRQMPWFFTFVFDGWTSLKRVADLLSLHNLDLQPRPESFQKLHPWSQPSIPALDIQGLSFELDGRKLLDQLSFHVDTGEFLAVVGEVGSGKSLLLLSLMGETGATFEKYGLGRNDALQMPLDQLRQFYTFVPQEGFIMSASLRENVAFDYAVENAADEKVLSSLRRAQFDLVQERVSRGLETEIGERGVNLSGGQRQRVSLGRVDYFDSPIVLLDDCLSAVDVETEKLLIHDLLDGSWKDRTRLLVTHRLSILHEVDRILFLEHGRIQAEGTFDELMRSSPTFREYTATIARSENASTIAAIPASEATTEVPDESERSSDSV